jgi:hypothetical protein
VAKARERATRRVSKVSDIPSSDCLRLMEKYKKQIPFGNDRQKGKGKYKYKSPLVDCSGFPPLPR